MHNQNNELKPLKEARQKLKNEGRIRVAPLFGSYTRGTPHKRSVISTVFIGAGGEKWEAIP